MCGVVHVHVSDSKQQHPSLYYMVTWVGQKKHCLILCMRIYSGALFIFYFLNNLYFVR